MMEGGCYCNKNIIEKNCDLSPHVIQAGDQLAMMNDQCESSPYVWCMGNWDCHNGAQCFDMMNNYFFETASEECSPDGQGCYCKENVRSRNCHYAPHLKPIRDEYMAAEKSYKEAKNDNVKKGLEMVMKTAEDNYKMMEMQCNAGDYTFCQDQRDCDGEKMCFDTAKMEGLYGRNQCSFEGYGCLCVTKEQIQAHESGEEQKVDKKCYNNPHLRHIEDWHNKEREMCAMDERIWCESNEQCHGTTTCFEEYTNFFMERDSFCNNYQGGCFCRDKPKNNFCEFSADVMRVMKKLDDAYVNMDFDTKSS
jgi:hypothetical protein